VRKYKKGDEVEAVVLGIDVEKERISLGIKQLEGDPFTNFIAANDKGSLVTAPSSRWMPGRRDALTTTSKATCALRKSRATAWKTPATC
jgi:predicted RNA-binding protein with RPS1 domain